MPPDVEDGGWTTSDRIRAARHHPPAPCDHPLKTASGRPHLTVCYLRMKVRMTGDAVPRSQRPSFTPRGSRRRLKRIKAKGNHSLELWILVAWVAFLLVIVLPWMLRHSR